MSIVVGKKTIIPDSFVITSNTFGIHFDCFNPEKALDTSCYWVCSNTTGNCLKSLQAVPEKSINSHNLNPPHCVLCTSCKACFTPNIPAKIIEEAFSSVWFLDFVKQIWKKRYDMNNITVFLDLYHKKVSQSIFLCFIFIYFLQ